MVDKSEQLQIIRNAEELKSEADARTAGIIKTDDATFAFRVSELMRDFFFFIDEHEEEMGGRERDANDAVNEMEYLLEQAQNKLQKIRDHVDHVKKLNRIEDILDNGDS
jgi:hypothetical protein